MGNCAGSISQQQTYLKSVAALGNFAIPPGEVSELSGAVTGLDKGAIPPGEVSELSGPVATYRQKQTTAATASRPSTSTRGSKTVNQNTRLQDPTRTGESSVHGTRSGVLKSTASAWRAEKHDTANWGEFAWL
jgi:hypothetical protein